MAIVNKKRLKQYLEAEQNVLFRGAHGIGKTAIVKEIFAEGGGKWKYFSASTMDPWVDFVGVPKVITDLSGNHSLELVRPTEFDDVEYLFFDEFNRAPDKVLNATMELIQFKSINGHKLKRLKVIWAAINPEDDADTYKVNHLDPAHLDRFQVHIDLPYDVDVDYFKGKYPTLWKAFVDWWKDLPEDVKKEVSPRRLDYAATAYQKDFRLEDFLPFKSNVKKLRDMLKSIPFAEELSQIKNGTEAHSFLKNPNNTLQLLKMVRQNDSNATDFFTKYAYGMPQELAAPFTELLEARNMGFMRKEVTTLAAILEKIPVTGASSSGTLVAGMINAVDWDVIMKGKSPENEMRALLTTKGHLVSRFTNRASDAFQNATKAQLERILWGPLGRVGNEISNFQVMLAAASKIRAFDNANEVRMINAKLEATGLLDWKIISPP